MGKMKVLTRVVVAVTEEDREQLINRRYGMRTRSGDKHIGLTMSRHIARGIELENVTDTCAELARAIGEIASRNKKFPEAMSPDVLEEMSRAIDEVANNESTEARPATEQFNS